MGQDVGGRRIECVRRPTVKQVRSPRVSCHDRGYEAYDARVKLVLNELLVVNDIGAEEISWRKVVWPMSF